MNQAPFHAAVMVEIRKDYSDRPMPSFFAKMDLRWTKGGADAAGGDKSIRKKTAGGDGRGEKKREKNIMKWVFQKMLSKKDQETTSLKISVNMHL